MSDHKVDILLFGGTSLERSSNITLEDCGLFNNATIVALFRVTGHD